MPFTTVGVLRTFETIFSSIEEVSYILNASSVLEKHRSHKVLGPDFRHDEERERETSLILFPSIK